MLKACWKSTRSNSFEPIKVFIVFSVLDLIAVIIEFKFLNELFIGHNHNGEQNKVLMVDPPHLVFFPNGTHVVNCIHLRNLIVGMSDVARKWQIIESVKKHNHFVWSIGIHHKMLLVLCYIDFGYYVVVWNFYGHEI